MTLRFVLDEQLRGHLWRALLRHNAAGADPIDVVRVGDSPDLPLGIPDPDVLVWAEREGRILVSVDWSTMSGHFAVHLQSGHHSPGLCLLRRRHSLSQLVDILVLAAHASLPGEWVDQIKYLP